MPTAFPTWAWAVFTVFILTMLALDLGVFNRKSHSVSVKEALRWTGVWVSLAVVFGLGVWKFYGSDPALKFFTGYLIEYSLSVDNIFVFLLVFGYFKVEPEHQHKVLFWGIIGALVMRAMMITVGAALLHRFEWIIYVFGAFLIFTGLKMAFGKEANVDPSQNPAVRVVKRFMPITDNYHGAKFFVMENGRQAATPLFVVLMVVETTDLIFAVDSIPAIFAVSRDPFIVFTSNVFAILGLRSLYFALAGVMDLFHYLKYALAIILSFIGIKMLLSHSPYAIPTPVALGVVVGVLAIAVVASLLKPKKPVEADEIAAP